MAMLEFIADQGNDSMSVVLCLRLEVNDRDHTATQSTPNNFNIQGNIDIKFSAHEAFL
jgi:hypothetical protein